MTDADETDILSELNRAADRAEQLVTQINERLLKKNPTPAGFRLTAFLDSERAVRQHVEAARRCAQGLRTLPKSEEEEQRARQLMLLRRGTLAVQLEVSRLAAMLELLL